ncbi:MAG: hypothetical protein WBG30_07335 [Psychrilyobacter sp.]|uniref:hypothetical protein n=1 Tax=Psychrilyobacter sp. TaxID=2586924 RepID=UPI003C77A94B
MKRFLSIIGLIGLFAFSNNLYAVKVINFKHNFENFWDEAKGKDFIEQEKSWNKNIESIDPVFYDFFVWGKEHSSTWKENRKITLKELFSMYSEIDMDQYLKTYDEYEKTITGVLKKYDNRAPDYKANITIMIAPGITWGGSYAKISKNNKEYLGLGIDKYFEFFLQGKSLPIEPLTIHEMFHHYHFTIRGHKISKSFDNYLKNGKLFWQLWDEGMAVWGTGYIGENENFDYILLGNKGLYDPTQNNYYAKLFLKDLNNPAIDLKKPINYKKWFGSNVKNNPLGEKTPPMIGYYLGWVVIKGIEAQGIKREEFMNWDYEEAKPHIIEQLKIISQNK